jgi:hypothetical protein
MSAPAVSIALDGHDGPRPFRRIADRANIWITTENGNLTIEQIEQLYGSLSQEP